MDAPRQRVRGLSSLARIDGNDKLTVVKVRQGLATPEECRRLVQLAADRPASEGVTDRPVEGLRDSTVRWLYPDEQSAWFFNRLEQALADINRSYRFDLKGFYEGAQIATYEPGGHYGWHMDIGQGLFSTRKLSMSLQLSDPEDYDGGELEFRASSTPAPKEQGSLIVFPAFLEHRVRPVTRGTRLSLVSWVAGPPYR